LVDNDTAYFKVDDATRPQFEGRGRAPLRPYGEDGKVMQYYEVPADVLEDPGGLGAWLKAAIGAAQRAKRSLASARPLTSAGG
jgi:DNA transformation protein